MEAARHRHWRSRQRWRTLALTWLAIAIAWITVVYLVVSIDQGPGGLPGSPGLRILVITIVFLGTGILSTRNRYSAPPDVGLLTHTRPGGRSPDLGTRPDAGRWSRPKPDLRPDRADEDFGPREGAEHEGRERHLGLRRFKVPKAYRDVTSDQLRVDPTDHNRDPPAPPAA